MFHIFGFPVRFRASFFVMSAVLGMGRDTTFLLTWVAIVSVSVLIHELGHAVVMRAFGGSPTIELHALGGHAQYGADLQLTERQQIAVAVAGPGAGFLFGGAAFLMQRLVHAPPGTIVDTAFEQLLWVNLGWGLFNLLPMLPLDGGHVLRAGLNRLTGGKGTRPAQIASMVVGVAVSVYGLYARMTWVALIAAWCVQTAYREMAGARARRDDGSLWPELERAQAMAASGDRPGARAAVEAVLERGRSSELRRTAALILAWLCVAERDGQAAAAALGHVMQTGAVVPAGLQGAVLAIQGRPCEARLHLEAALADEKENRLFFLAELGKAYAACEEPDRAVALLQGEYEALADQPVFVQIGAALFYAGAYSQAATVESRAFERFGNPMDAYNVACCYAQTREPAAAIAWLQRAVSAGWKDVATLESDKDLDPIRDQPAFVAIVEGMRVARTEP